MVLSTLNLLSAIALISVQSKKSVISERVNHPKEFCKSESNTTSDGLNHFVKPIRNCVSLNVA